jgi:hypothetical protein
MIRSTARIAFQRYIEECAFDNLPIPDEPEELEEEQESEPEEISTLPQIARKVLTHFDLQDHTDVFLAYPDGIAILANCCNAAAKWYDDTLYQYKPTLIKIAAPQHPECWAEQGIVYFETSVGQVSFHALYGEDKDLPPAQGRTWSELEYQMNAPLVAQAYLQGWPKEVLQAKIQERD